MTNNCDVSVVIPTFNSAHLVGRAIDSVLAQSLPVREIIVADDGSTDDTLAVVRRYEPRVRYIYQENAGVSAARNHGIREATGEWIAFLDADDEWLPHMMASHSKSLRRNPSLVWSFCNEESCANRSIPAAVKKELARMGSIRYFAAILEMPPSGTPGFMIRRSVLMELGGFDRNLWRGGDVDMWWRIAMVYPLIGYCLDPCWRWHRDTPGSLTKGSRSRDMQLHNVLVHMKRAEAHGAAAVRDFHPLARKLAVNFLLRMAAGQVSISTEIVRQAKIRFPPRFGERMMMTVLRHSPGLFARKLLNRISL